MTEFETLLYDERDGVAWVTLNRPERHNAFNPTMRDELGTVWRSLRTNDDVRAAVLTASGDKAFCTGIDRDGVPAGEDEFDWDPLTYDDIGIDLGPKSQNLWKPVIGAVNGMACGGAFYMLGEVDFIIAADHATFFDPHVTYGMTAVYEPLLMMRRMPLAEILRLTLLGNHERMSAKRAYEIGLVSEVVPAADLLSTAEWAATAIASQPPRAVQATLRTIWAGRELSPSQSLELGATFMHLGIDMADLEAGQSAFSSGKRIEWRTR